MLILEDAFENKKLLTAAVGMSGEMAMRRVTNDRSSAGHLIPDAIQHPPVDAGHRRRYPSETRSMHDDPL